jgi:hypothetical protein
MNINVDFPMPGLELNLDEAVYQCCFPEVCVYSYKALYLVLSRIKRIKRQTIEEMDTCILSFHFLRK